MVAWVLFGNIADDTPHKSFLDLCEDRLLGECSVYDFCFIFKDFVFSLELEQVVSLYGLFPGSRAGLDTLQA